MSTHTLGIVAAVAAAAALGGAFAYVEAGKDRDRYERLLQDLERPERPPPHKAAPKPQRRDSEKEVSELSTRVRLLEAKQTSLLAARDRLRAENDRLKSAAAPATAALPNPNKGLPGADPLATRPAEPYTAPPGYPPPPGTPAPMEGGGEVAWGAAEASEMEELSAAVGLTPEQREPVRLAIVEGQQEFERRLIELGQQRGNDKNTDMMKEVEKVGDEVYKKTYARIFDMLTPEQQKRFAEYMNKKEHGE
jgi:hypothetical protein